MGRARTSGSLLHGMWRSAVAIADDAVISTIEVEGVAATDALAVRWRDVRPLIDEREQPGEWIDRNAEYLGYALARGLIECHPKQAHLVRILRRWHEQP